MTIYLSSYLFICLSAIISLIKKNNTKFFWYSSLFILILINTLKWNIGGDWWVYYDYTIISKSRTLFEILNVSEPGFMLLTWINSRLNLDLPGINFFASVIFFLGFQKLLKDQNDRWISLLIILPITYFIIFQGYIRQGIALGFVFFAVANLIQQKNYYFLFFIFLAFLFHRSALFCLLFYFHDFFNIKNYINKITIILFIIISLGVLYIAIPFFKNEINYIYKRFSTDILIYYTNKNRISFGAIPRGIINILPAIILILFWKNFIKYKDFSILFTMSIIVFFLFILSFYYSTIADRLSVYLCILQILIYPRFINLISDYKLKYLTALIIILVYVFIFIFYILYADNSNQYTVYSIYFFRDLPLECQLLPYEACK